MQALALSPMTISTPSVVLEEEIEAFPLIRKHLGLRTYLAQVFPGFTRYVLVSDGEIQFQRARRDALELIEEDLKTKPGTEWSKEMINEFIDYWHGLVRSREK